VRSCRSLTSWLSWIERAVNLHERLHDYLNAGLVQVWVLWPRQRSVSVYRSGRDTRELKPDETLDGGDNLPGFSIRVSDMFGVQRTR
jgi:hypothetical protein